MLDQYSQEVSLIFGALDSVLRLDAKVALEAIFNQLLTQLDESTDLVNTFAFKFLNEKFSSSSSSSTAAAGGETDFKPAVEALVETHGVKLLAKLSGKDEFPLVVGLLASLKAFSTLTGRQRLINELVEQARLLGKVSSAAKYGTLVQLCRQAVKLLSVMIGVAMGRYRG